MKNYQISAARAIAGWSQTELAERAGSSLTTISQAESGNAGVSAKLAEKIERVFKAEGIFFTERGVEKRDTAIYTIEGKNWWLQVLDDVYQSMVDKKAEILLFCADDRESSTEVNEAWRRIRKLGSPIRQLVREDNDYLLAPVEEYRWIPKEYFTNYITMIYGEKVCLCAENNTKAVIFKDKQLARMMTNLFNWNWKNAEQPSESNAPAEERL